MNGLVRELSRELARCALDYFMVQDEGALPLDEEQLSTELFERAVAWLDGQDVQQLMLKVLAHRL